MVAIIEPTKSYTSTDRDVFLEFMKWLRRLPFEAAPMKDMFGMSAFPNRDVALLMQNYCLECEVTPGPDVKTEEELLGEPFLTTSDAMNTQRTTRRICDEELYDDVA